MTTDQASASLLTYRLDYLGTFTVTLHSAIEIIGPVPAGLRMTAYIGGGDVNGPRLNGRLRPVGAGWFTVRPDGMILVDVRTTIETDDGALIAVAYTGVIDLGPDGYARVSRVEAVPSGTQIRTAASCESDHPCYTWLNRVQCIGIGALLGAGQGVRYDLYALG